VDNGFFGGKILAGLHKAEKKEKKAEKLGEKKEDS